MIESKETLTGNIISKQTISGSVNATAEKILPTLEDITIIPQTVQQVFTHENSDGYNKVTVEAIPEIKLQDKEITPSKDTQTIISDTGYDGLNEVKVNPIPNSYIEPSGTLPITENGTYDVTQYAEVITNIEASGGSGSLNAESLEDLSTKILELTTNATDTLCKMHDINEPYINAPVTLYTPLATHKHYFIRYRSGGYQVIWSPSAYLQGTKGSINLNLCNLSYEVRTAYGVGKFETGLTMESVSGDVAYRSNSYSTIEECIEAIQNPSTSYIKGAAGQWPSEIVDDTSMTPFTNCACYWSDNTPCPARRISKDETIEVI